MKTVLITGSANGIGKETALLFAKKGWKVIATVRNLNNCEELKNKQNIHLYQMDVRNKPSIEDCIYKAINQFDKIDALINNAGIYTINPLEVTSDEIIENIIDTNICGVINVTKALLPHFRENRNGLIVNISSIAGRATFPFQSVYHTSKWAIEGFSEGLYYELEPLNIKVKVIEPGVVKTNIYNSVMNYSLDNYPTEYHDNFNKGYFSLMNNLKKGYEAELDAQTIYRAVTDNKNRLRYTTDNQTKLALLLHSLLPLSVFRKIISKISGISLAQYK